MGRTSTASKTKYNKYAYARYTIRIRKDSWLYDDIEEFMGRKGTSLNGLVEKLLSEYFSDIAYDQLAKWFAESQAECD